MRTIPVVLTLATAALFTACGGGQKIFKVTSHPKGATIYIDDKNVGQTDMEKLNVTFIRNPQVTLRLEKDGYQSKGHTLKFESDREQFIVLDEAPNNKAITEGLKKIEVQLDTLPTRMAETMKANDSQKSSKKEGQ